MNDLPPPSAQTPEESFFGEEELGNIGRLIESHKEAPEDAENLMQLRILREGVANFLAGAELGTLEGLFKTDFGQVYRLMLKSGLRDEALTPEEEDALAALFPVYGHCVDSAGSARVPGVCPLPPGTRDIVDFPPRAHPRVVLGRLSYLHAHGAPGV